jgi:hypothetical protein
MSSYRSWLGWSQEHVTSRSGRDKRGGRCGVELAPENATLVTELLVGFASGVWT